MNPAKLLAVCTGNGNGDFINGLFATYLRQYFHIPQYRDAMNFRTLLGRIVVNKSHHFILSILAPHHFTKEGLAGISSSYNQKSTGGATGFREKLFMVEPDYHSDAGQ